LLKKIIFGIVKLYEYVKGRIHIEAGSAPNPTIETVAKIAKALEVSVDDLLNKSKACLSAEALAPVEENPVRPGRIFALRIFRLGWLL
jgi:transcriptional regulator with XRE-family HTH domain